MRDGFVLFDDMWDRVSRVFSEFPGELSGAGRVYLIRDLRGMVRLAASEEAETPDTCRVLNRLARQLQETLGPHGYETGEGVLFVLPEMLADLDEGAREIHPGVYWAERLVTGRDWWTVSAPRRPTGADRYTLYSVKGGVGRSTTAAVLAWHLARSGESVLVVDLDLESPGLSSAMLDPSARPEFGVTDWFVEDLVEQGDHVSEGMVAAPAWAKKLAGDVRVVPAHGREPGEYLAKLGRVYMDTFNVPWTARLDRLLRRLEEKYQPSIVLLESRSGLHDIAAATVTDLGAHVLLFAVDEEGHWTDYGMLFRHWQTQGLAPSIRERLSFVSALTPETETERYLHRFRKRTWKLFRDYLYDAPGPADGSKEGYSFDLREEGAPHEPIAIQWARAYAPGPVLNDWHLASVQEPYAEFLARFDKLLAGGRNGRQLAHHRSRRHGVDGERAAGVGTVSL